MPTSSKPKVSAIVPIYNVAEYLAETLRSLERQSIDSLEVVLVDDGSTDESPEIAEYYAAKHDSWHFFRKENGGPGAARNFGVKHSSGSYLAFCDADDLVAEYAYERLYDIAEKHHADFAVGGMNRFDSAEYSSSKMHEKAFEGATEILALSTHPQLIYDTTTPDKLFNREFYLRNLSFPEGVFYEDVPFNIKAYCKAEKIAFLDEIVYSYRIRDGESKSTTQKRAEWQNFLNRYNAVKAVDDFFEAEVTDPQLRTEKDRRILDLDFIIFLNAFPEASEQYRRQFAELVCPYLERVEKNTIARLRAVNRIKYQLLQEKRFDELVSFIEYSQAKDQYGALSLRKDENNRLHGSFPFEELSPFSTDMTEETRREGLYTRVDSISFEDGNITIAAEMHMTRLGSGEDDDISVVAWLEPAASNATGIELPASLKIRKKPKTDVRKDSRYGTVRKLRRAKTRLFITLDEDTLSALSNDSYRIRIEYTINDFSCYPCYLRRHASAPKAMPDAQVRSNRVISFTYNWHDELKLRLFDKPETTITQATLQANGRLELIDAKGDTYLAPVDFSRAAMPHIPIHQEAELYYFDNPIYCFDTKGTIRITGSADGTAVAEKLPAGYRLHQCTSAKGRLGLQLSSPYQTVKEIVGVLLIGEEHEQVIEPSFSPHADGETDICIDFTSLAYADNIEEDSYRLYVMTQNSQTPLPVYWTPNRSNDRLPAVSIRERIYSLQDGNETLVVTARRAAISYHFSSRYGRALERRLCKLRSNFSLNRIQHKPSVSKKQISASCTWRSLHGIPEKLTFVLYIASNQNRQGVNLRIDFPALIDALEGKCIFAFGLENGFQCKIREDQLDARVIDLTASSTIDRAMSEADVIIVDNAQLAAIPTRENQLVIIFSPMSKPDNQTPRDTAEDSRCCITANSPRSIINAIRRGQTD